MESRTERNSFEDYGNSRQSPQNNPKKYLIFGFRFQQSWPTASFSSAWTGWWVTTIFHWRDCQVFAAERRTGGTERSSELISNPMLFQSFNFCFLISSVARMVFNSLGTGNNSEKYSRSSGACSRWIRFEPLNFAIGRSIIAGLTVLGRPETNFGRLQCLELFGSG